MGINRYGVCRISAAPVVIALFAFLYGAAPPAVAQMPESRPGQGENRSGPSSGEMEVARKIRSAPDAAAKLQAASDFVKQYPKSAFRKNLVQLLAGEIGRVVDPAQRIALAEKALTIFKEPAEADEFNGLLFDAYLGANRTDDAFRVGGSLIEKNPDDVTTLTGLTLSGANQARQKNAQFVTQSEKYGAKAIALMEADKKPASMQATDWSQYKTRWLPQLYQALGLFAYLKGDRAGAKTKAGKAVSLGPADATNYLLLGILENDEYQQLAQQYKSASPGQAQGDLLRKAIEQLDRVIDAFAHTVALSEANPQLKPLHDQVFQNLQSYYKYRHKGSADGLQELIDKYKKPST